MRTYKMLAASAAIVALGIILTAVQAADAPSPREQIEKLAGIAAKSPDDLQKQADAYVKGNKDVGLDDVMNLLKKRSKDNPDAFGIGKTPTGQMDDGIEARIQNYAKKVSKDALKKQQDKDDMMEALNRLKAIAAIAVAKKPDKKMGDKDPKDWAEYSERMIKGTDEMKKAIESGDTKVIKDAAAKLNSSCTDCHAKFRD